MHKRVKEDINNNKILTSEKAGYLEGFDLYSFN